MWLTTLTIVVFSGHWLLLCFAAARFCLGPLSFGSHHVGLVSTSLCLNVENYSWVQLLLNGRVMLLFFLTCLLFLAQRLQHCGGWKWGGCAAPCVRQNNVVPKKDKRESAYKAHFRRKSVTEDKENTEVTVVNVILFKANISRIRPWHWKRKFQQNFHWDTTVMTSLFSYWLVMLVRQWRRSSQELGSDHIGVAAETFQSINGCSSTSFLGGGLRKIVLMLGLNS